jgi:hypothetical protein
VGRNFFERYPAGNQPFAARRATDAEIDEFVRLTTPKVAALIVTDR